MDYTKLEELIKISQDMDFDELKNLNQKLKEFQEYRKQNDTAYDALKKDLLEGIKSLNFDNDNWKKSLHEEVNNFFEKNNSEIAKTLDIYKQEEEVFQTTLSEDLEKFKSENENWKNILLKTSSDNITSELQKINIANKAFIKEVESEIELQKKTIESLMLTIKQLRILVYVIVFVVVVVIMISLLKIF